MIDYIFTVFPFIFIYAIVGSRFFCPSNEEERFIFFKKMKLASDEYNNAVGGNSDSLPEEIAHESHQSKQLLRIWIFYCGLFAISFFLVFIGIAKE